MANYTKNIPLQVYSQSFQPKSIVDVYESVIWTDSYCSSGDFELKILLETAKKYGIKIDDFLYFPPSLKMMVVEKIGVEYASDNSVTLIYSGRTLESLLDRRVMMSEFVPGILPVYDSQNDKYISAPIRKLTETIYYCLGRSIIPNVPNFQNQSSALTSASRGISSLGYVDTTDDDILDQNAPYMDIDGMTLYDLIHDYLYYYGYGFSIDFNPSGVIGGNDPSARYMLFRIYNGKNRTYTQTKNDRVIFSPDDDTTFKMDTTIDTAGVKNAAVIVGPTKFVRGTDPDTGDPILVDTNKRFTSNLYSGVSGFKRKEVYVDATDIPSSDDARNIPYSDQYVSAKMRLKAIKEIKTSITGQITYTPSIDFNPFKEYGKDYYLGDTVTVMDDLGNTQMMRIDSFTHSLDSSGYKAHPNFESVESVGGYRVVEQTDGNGDIIRELEISDRVRVTEHNNLDLFDNTEIGG